MKKVALITGANRGIGLETTKQLGKKGYHVILTSRDEAKGQAAVAAFQKEGLDVSFCPLDVADQKSVDAALAWVKKNVGRLDVLVNNAGVFLESRDGGSTVETGDIQVIRDTLEINTYGVFRMCQAFIPMMVAQKYGRIVNLSSGMGQLTDMNGGYPAYRISKTAVNAITRIFANETQGTGVLINSVCPGWVKTDMGGAASRAELGRWSGHRGLVFDAAFGRTDWKVLQGPRADRLVSARILSTTGGCV